MGYQGVAEDEVDQIVDAVDATIEIEDDLTTKTETNARTLTGVTTAIHRGVFLATYQNIKIRCSKPTYCVHAIPVFLDIQATQSTC